MHLIEKGILNNSMSVFMPISCVADNLQFKDTDCFGKKSLDLCSFCSDNLQKTRSRSGSGEGGGREEPQAAG